MFLQLPLLPDTICIVENCRHNIVKGKSMNVQQKTKRLKHLLSLVLIHLLIISSIEFSSISVHVSGHVIQPIYTKEDLSNIRNDLSGTYKLMNNISFNDEDFQPGGAFYNQGKGWIPLGNEPESTFLGSFDGNGFSISGLTLTPSNVKEGVYGLFGYSEGNIKNLELSNLAIRIHANVSEEEKSDYTNIFVGGIAGKIIGGTISGCTISGTIEVNSNNINVYAAGVGGSNHDVWGNVSIKDCHNRVDINIETTDANANAAGIVNWGSSLSVTGSSNTGDIRANVNRTGDTIYDASAGGIANYLRNSAKITSSYNLGDVLASVDSKESFATTQGAGGIVASNQALVYQCFNAGTVTSDSKMTAGGIAGDNNDGSRIIDCFNVGTVQYGRSICTGGIAGTNYGVISTSYNLGDVEFKDDSGEERITKNVVGNSTSYMNRITNCYKAEGEEILTEKGVKTLTVQQLSDQVSFEGFNFTTVWAISEGIPYLQSIGEKLAYIVGFEVDLEHDMVTGEKQQIIPRLLGQKNQVIALFSYESMDPDIVQVDKSGLIQARKAGKTKLIVTEQFTGKTKVISVEVKQGPTSIRISGNKKIEIGSSEPLRIEFLPLGSVPSKVTWESRNKNIATVNEEGLVTGLSGGTATIVAKTKNGLSATYYIDVVEYPSSLEFAKSELILSEGDTKTLEYTLLPTNTTETELIWNSSDSETVSVDETGKVTANRVGTTTITATTVNGIHAQVNVTVLKPITNLEILNKDISLGKNKSITLKLQITPNDTTEKEIIFTSSDETIATVTNEGIVTGHKDGTAIITVSTVDKRLTKKVIVEVGEPVSSLELSHTELNLLKNETTLLTATLTPDNAINKEVEFISQDESVATVDQNGNVKAVGIGTTEIIVKSTDGSEITSTCLVTVKQKVNSLSISSITAQTFTGSAIKPEVIIKDGKYQLQKGKDYSLKWKNNTNAGTAKVTVAGKGNYSGTKEITFTIKAKGIKDLTISKVSNQTYSGKALKPSVTITYKKKNLKKGTDYKLEYQSNTNIGKATIIIRGMGNYTGTKKVQFIIKPSKTVLSSVKSSKSKSVVASWKSIKGVSGYQVFYATSQNGSYKLAGTTKKTSYTVSKLKSKSTVYVKVRAYKKIDGKNVYGAYSNVIKAKVK